ncbi:MAG: LamG-like jellyroll fold domain-containing protein, partial [Planctomycetota bacterium]
MSKRLIFLTSFVLVLSLVGSASAVLNYEYYEAPEGSQYQALADVGFGTATPVRTGTSDTLDSGDGNWVEQAGGHRADDFAFRFTGYIVVPVDGEITFYLRSDDGSQLFIDGTMVVDNDGLHGTEGFPGDPGTITLTAGAYTFEATQFERGGGDSIHVAWSAGGFDPRRVPDSVLFLEAPADISVVPPTVLVDLNAIAPIPADGAVDADVTSLEWSPGYGAVSHKVYLSTDETIEESELVAETDLTIHLAALEDGTTYYWRVDEVDATGAVTEGTVWSFSTIPLEAHFPNPADGATSQPLDAQLSWTAGKVVIMHDVYFGTDEALVAARDPGTFKGKLMTASYDPGALDMETTYYWAVDQFVPTGTVSGPVWNFTTFGAIEITDPDLLVYYDFEHGEGEVALDQSGHSNHGQFVGDPQWATGYLAGGLDFDGDGDYLDAGTNDQLDNLSDAITVSAWVNIRSVTTTWMSIVMKGETAWRLGVNGDTTGVHWGFTGGARGWQAANSVTELPLGEWHHIAGTYDRSVGGTVWVDGVAETVNPDPDGVATNQQPLLTGENPEATGRFFDGLLDEVRIYNKALTGVEILKLVGAVSDVTAAGDVVKGVPDEPRDGSVAGWPDGEYPWLAVDDDVSTKFLHFRGEVSPTGFVVEPASGASIVTGLTFTTANDATERDPISFELSGSNDSIDGPYTLIASGDI